MGLLWQTQCLCTGKRGQVVAQRYGLHFPEELKFLARSAACLRAIF